MPSRWIISLPPAEIRDQACPTRGGKALWLLIASEAMVKDGELPEDWGLMVAHANGLRIVKKAPDLLPEPPTVEFITGLMRANKRDAIPEDLHKQYLNDAKLDIERKLKTEYAELKSFVTAISDAFGIKLEQDKHWDYHTRKDVKTWTSRVRGNYKKYTPEELKALIESVLSGDMNDARNKLHSALEDVEKAAEVLKKYQGYSRW